MYRTRTRDSIPSGLRCGRKWNRPFGNPSRRQPDSRVPAPAQHPWRMVPPGRTHYPKRTLCPTDAYCRRGQYSGSAGEPQTVPGNVPPSRRDTAPEINGLPAIRLAQWDSSPEKCPIAVLPENSRVEKPTPEPIRVHRARIGGHRWDRLQILSQRRPLHRVGDRGSDSLRRWKRGRCCSSCTSSRKPLTPESCRK